MTEPGEYVLPFSASRPAPKYGQYQVPGGENYRETLSVMPERPRTDLRYSIMGDDGVRRPAKATTREEAIAEAGDPQRVLEIASDPDPVNYRGAHFNDPNILVHSRSNQRTLPTGERGTLIENVQSDWHQAGRKQGYATPKGVAPTPEQAKTYFGISDADWRNSPELHAGYVQDMQDHINGTGNYAGRPKRELGVPDAPFKDSWPALGLKQEVLDAVERGDEWIGITPASILNSRGEAISEAFQDQRLPLTLEKILKPSGGGRVELGPVTTAPPDLRFATGGEGPRGLQVVDGEIGPTLASVLPGTDGIGAMELIQQMRARGAGTPATTNVFRTPLTAPMRAYIKKHGIELLMAALAAHQGLTPRPIDTPPPPR